MTKKNRLPVRARSAGSAVMTVTSWSMTAGGAFTFAMRGEASGVLLAVVGLLCGVISALVARPQLLDTVGRWWVALLYCRCYRRVVKKAVAEPGDRDLHTLLRVLDRTRPDRQGGRYHGST